MLGGGARRAPIVGKLLLLLPPPPAGAVARGVRLGGWGQRKPEDISCGADCAGLINGPGQ